jgi:integrase
MVTSSTFKWDRAGEKYTFETLQEVLKARMEKSKTDKEYTYYAILLTQLVNGARIGEAVNGFYEFVRTGKRELRVKVEKQRKEKYRLFIVPPIISYERVVWLEKEKPRKIVPRVKMFIRKKLDLNSHSLRYLFISYMARRGVSAQEIARITGHENLNHILHYTRKIEAEDRFKQIMGEMFTNRGV